MRNVSQIVNGKERLSKNQSYLAPAGNLEN